MTSRNDPCWCGSGKKWKKCHPQEKAPLSQATLQQKYLKQWGIQLKNEQQIAKIRKACQFTAYVLEKACQMAKPGITTEAIDQYIYDLHKQHGAIPAPLGYGDPPYTKSCCISLNDVICHGIPDKTVLKEGDILNIDVSSIVDGYFGDCSKMVVLGAVTEEKLRVTEVSKTCLDKAIEILKPGVMLLEIGNVIEDYARAHGCSVVNQFIGHGVGLQFHEAPEVPHHYNSLMIPLAEGMIFTIEPMINAGVYEAVIDAHDGWTARTRDGLPSAQWEHTVLITATSHEILTRYEPVEAL